MRSVRHIHIAFMGGQVQKALALEPQTPKKTMGTSVQLGAGIAQCHNIRGTDFASVPSAALHAGQISNLQWPPSGLSRQILHLQWPASGLSGQMLHFFWATMVIGRSWSVIAVQMQHLVLCIFPPLQSTLQSLSNIIELAVDSCAFPCLDPLPKSRASGSAA